MTYTTDSTAQGYLPFAAPAGFKADYLCLVVQRGGEAVRVYKDMSFDLLEMEEGMQVLDVGCGVGIDLPQLARRVGDAGRVIGLELDPDLVRAARQAIGAENRPALQVVQGDAEQMPFTDVQFDRVRADRAVQHMERPERAIAEMWRVLRPGGILTLVEPDWGGLMLYPGSPAGGDNDSTLQHILGYLYCHLPHPLIGRQLHGHLHRQHDAWEQIRVQAVSFTHTSWKLIDVVCQVSATARACVRQDPTCADEVEAWLHALEVADRQEEFLACVPLFFALARKSQ
jgi:SAM-dependent methyltransferase